MPAFAREIYHERLEKVREGMYTAGTQLLVLPPSGDMEYLTGLSVEPSERFTAFLLPLGDDPQIICPAFETESFLGSSVIADVLPWEEHQDPFSLLRTAFKRVSAMALGASTPFGFVERVRAAFPDPILTSASSILAPLRARKAPEELEALREAQGHTRARLLEAATNAKVGQTEESISKDLGGAIVLFGRNAAYPHGIAGDRPLARDDVLLIDAGGRCRGYCSDITRTFIPRGQPRLREIWEIVLEAQSAAHDKAGPGVEAQEVDRAAREVIRKAGHEESFIHRTGHGVGLEIHEPPYLVEGNRTLLQTGMTMTIEPGIYIPGEFGIRIEDVFTITADGSLPLSPLDREPFYRG